MHTQVTFASMQAIRRNGTDKSAAPNAQLVPRKLVISRVPSVKAQILSVTDLISL